MPVKKLDEFFEKMLANLNVSDRFAVAVSGGADSMALVRLAHTFCQKKNLKLIALTVDHDMRCDSAKEAHFVATCLRNLGIEHHILSSTRAKPTTKIEETLRQIRYDLLIKACVDFKCNDLFVGHHLQDQAETFLMRQAKKSTPFGLACMSMTSIKNNIRLLRPLLGVSPDILRTYLQSIGQEWVTDSSNFSDAFERNRLRKTLTPTHIHNAFEQSLVFSQKRLVSENILTDFIEKNVTLSDLGYVLFPQSSLTQLDQEHRLLFLGQMLRTIGNKMYMPSVESLSLLSNQIVMDQFKGATLCASLITPTVKKQILILKEYNTLPAPLTVVKKQQFSWDRFTFTLSEPYENPMTVCALDQRLDLSLSIPKRCFKTLPAFFDRQSLLLVPHLGYKQTSVECHVAFTPIFGFFKKSMWACPIRF